MKTLNPTNVLKSIDSFFSTESPERKRTSVLSADSFLKIPPQQNIQEEAQANLKNISELT